MVSYGLRDDYPKSFGCLPLQFVTIVAALATGCSAAYFGWTLFNPANFTDIRNIARILTVFSLSVAFLLSALVLCFCIPLTARLLLMGAATAVSSFVIEMFVGWIYLALLAANKSETKPGPTSNEITMQGIRTGVTIVLTLISYLFLLGYIQSLVKVLRESGTGWEGKDYLEIKELRERGQVIWRPKYVNTVHTKLRDVAEKARRITGIQINIDATTPPLSACSSEDSIRWESSEIRLPSANRNVLSRGLSRQKTQEREMVGRQKTQEREMVGRQKTQDGVGAVQMNMPNEYFKHGSETFIDPINKTPPPKSGVPRKYRPLSEVSVLSQPVSQSPHVLTSQNSRPDHAVIQEKECSVPQPIRFTSPVNPPPEFRPLPPPSFSSAAQPIQPKSEEKNVDQKMEEKNEKNVLQHQINSSVLTDE